MKVQVRWASGTVAVVAAVLVPAPAGQAATFKRCEKGKAPRCGVVRVPLDRGGAVKGSVKLAVLRIPARKRPKAGTVMLLAGGPGQGAIEALASSGRPLIAGLPRHEIVAFDQRGTGASGKLGCKALRQAKKKTKKRTKKKKRKGLGHQGLRHVRVPAGKAPGVLPQLRLLRGHRSRAAGDRGAEALAALGVLRRPRGR